MTYTTQLHITARIASVYVSDNMARINIIFIVLFVLTLLDTGETSAWLMSVVPGR